MLSLVNYGSSGESDSESDESKSDVLKSFEAPVSQNESKALDSPNVNSKSSNERNLSDSNEKTIPAHLNNQNVKRNEDDIDSKEESDIESSVVNSLPAPVSRVEDINWEMLSKLRYKTGAIKILAPPLPKDDESEKKKKKQPSTQGCGLLSILPKPKSESNTSMTPRILQPKTAPKIAPTKRLLPSTLKNKSKNTKPVASDSEDEDESSGDFFSLANTKEPALDEETLAKHYLPDTTSAGSSVGTNSDAHNRNTESSELIENSFDSEGYIPVENQELELNEEALVQLCGTRGLKRKAAELQMIDIDGSHMVPDADSILAKNLTQDLPRPVRPKGLGVTSQQKRKHQITYLAQQAKEQELELQNTWANNRMTKKQTQAKYGF